MISYDIVMTNRVGLYGTVRLVREKRDVLSERLPEYLIESAEGFEKYINKAPKSYEEAEIKVLGEGGLYRGLYDLSKEKKCGVKVFFKAIPIKQETIEICEIFGLNPYMLNSVGSALYITPQDKAEELLKKLWDDEVNAALIGHLTKGHDCIIKNGDRTTYIKPPKEDEYI